MITQILRSVTGEQRRIFIVIGIVILAFFVLVRFIYIPQKKRFEGLKKELSFNEAEIGRLKNMLGVTNEEAIAKSLDALQARMKAVNAKFSLKEETVLRELPNFAGRFNVKVKSMQPQRKKIVSQIEGIPVAVTGYDIMEMQIAIAATGTYKGIGSFLRLLRDEFPSPMMVNNLKLSRDAGESSEGLKMTCDMTTYLLSPQGKGG